MVYGSERDGLTLKHLVSCAQPCLFNSVRTVGTEASHPVASLLIVLQERMEWNQWTRRHS